MKKIDDGLRNYLLILIVSWIIIIVYFIFTENTDQKIKKELESYPYNHSQITDSTIENAK